MRHPFLCTASLTLIALALFAASARAATLQETFAQSYPFNSGSTFSLRTVNGAISIDVWDGNEVRIEAQKKVKARTEAYAKKVMDELKIEVQPVAGGLSVETKVPKRESGFSGWLRGCKTSISYQVHIPRNAVVNAISINGNVVLHGTLGNAKLEASNGNISATDVVGNLELATTNGVITALGVTGTMKAGTTNGNIDLQFATVPQQGDLEMQTSNGNVTVKLPRKTGVSVDAATTNGQVYSDFEVTGGKPGKSRLAGTINGGGNRLHIRTTNGIVRLVEG